MRKSLCLVATAILLALLAAPGIRAAEDAKSKTKSLAEELTLERLFPKKSVFGPSARAAEFSHDGRFAAYLYRPYLERRHGSDLWIYDVAAGEAKRITSVSVMAGHQDDARKVKKHRIEKQKKKKKGGGKASGEQERTDETDDDAFPDDGVSGIWDGRLTGGEDLGLSRDGLPVTLTLRVGDEGSLTGSMTWLLSKLRIVEGTWDAEAGTITCSLRGRDADTSAELEGRIEDGVLSGTLRIDGEQAELTLEARRRQDDAESEDDDGTEDDVEQDTEDQEDDGNDEEDEDEQDGDGDVEDEDDRLGDLVTEDDADDEKAPRYRGVSGFVWSPTADDLIFTSGGDLYLYRLEDESITRLTRTSESERAVQYLPDGSGYSYLSGSALKRVTFGAHLVEELNPKLGNGETMSGYRLSPDGHRLVILATKGESTFNKGRKVNIVNYRDRFANVRQVTRHVSDDPLPERVYSVYLYDLREHLSEQGALKKVYSHTQSGPRDILRVPEWSPDSSRVAWSVFEQSSGHVEILEARFVDEDEDAAGDVDSDEAEEDDGDDEEDEGEQDGDGDVEDEDGNDEGDDEDDDEPAIEEARAVYRLLHNGGPNTPSLIRPYYLPDSRRVVFITELSGYRHLHVLDPTYEQLDQLTRGRFEVYPLDITTDHRRLFCTATEGDPAQQHVYAVDLESGAFERLSHVEGVYDNVAVSPDGTRVLANLVDFGRLRELVVFEREDEEVAVITDSHPEEAKALTEPVPEYFTFENRHGQTIHGHMFKPAGWSAEDQRPLLIYVYGGPLGTRKMITRGAYSAASYFFAYYMAKKHGYVTCTIDPRGASGYGGLFEKANYEQVGKPQVEDLVDTARWFAEHQGVDKDRIGLHGWSFGGFQTQMCLYTEPKVFACGIAGAGPTEWENYNSWYSTGTIGPSREGKTDLEQFSLLPLAKNLEAELLLVHGMEDSNVLYQDTVRVYRELLKAGKETLVELFLDPTGGHGLGGDIKTVNRYRKYEEFLLRNLGEFATETDADVDEQEPGSDKEQPASRTGGRWLSLFNGSDLAGWTPKFAGHALGENYKNTFRVEDGVLKVVYEDYEGFDGEFGHLFYERPYADYLLRMEYRFTGEQTPGAPGWAFRNSGVMVHGQPPDSMSVDQPFPVSVEVQLLGGDGERDRPTGNVCTPGTHIVIDDELTKRHCIDSRSETYHGDQWVSVEIEVRGNQLIRHRINGRTVLEYGQPQLDESDADARRWLEQRNGEKLLSSGTISLQAESHPCEFRRIELLPLGD